MDKRRLATAGYFLAWLFLGLVAGCEPAEGPIAPVVAAGNASIPVHADKRGEQAYRPNPLVVRAGATVTWTNHDSIWHTVTSDTEGLFASEPIPTRGTFVHTFPGPGTFPYHCAIPGHQMTGVVVVEP